jgi:plastocyanin
MRRPLITAALALSGLMLGAAGCTDESGGDVTPDSTAPPVTGVGEVLVKSIAFTPKEVRTPVGKPVTWKFDDGGLEHTVTADDKSFDSGRMSSGTYPKIFNTPGTIAYHCEVHVRMKGTIVVTG